MQVRRIDPSNRRDVRRFVEFPFTLYCDCPLWIPPMRGAMARALDRRRHPFYEHSFVACYLAERDGRVVGRMAVMENTRYNAFHDRHDAFFGYVDFIEDEQVARGLIEAASAWARGRRLTRLRGPRAMLAPDAGGVLVDGYALRGAMGVPYNYTYYDELLRATGLETETELMSGYLDEGWQVPERIARVAERVRQRSHLSVRTFRSRKELRAIASQIMTVYQKAFVGRLTYYPMGEAEAALTVETLVAIADPRLIKVIERGDEVVGFLLAYPDISPALRRCRGRLWPWGWLGIVNERRRTRDLVVNGVALLPAYQGLGGNALLYAELGATALGQGYRHAELVQVDLLNDASLADNRAAGVTWVKRHRHYMLLL